MPHVGLSSMEVSKESGSAACLNSANPQVTSCPSEAITLGVHDVGLSITRDSLVLSFLPHLLISIHLSPSLPPFNHPFLSLFLCTYDCPTFASRGPFGPVPGPFGPICPRFHLCFLEDKRLQPHFTFDGPMPGSPTCPRSPGSFSWERAWRNRGVGTRYTRSRRGCHCFLAFSMVILVNHTFISPKEHTDAPTPTPHLPPSHTVSPCSRRENAGT